MNRRVLFALTALIAFGAGTYHAAEPTATELAQSLQKKYDGIRDFAADFTHVYRGGVLKKQLTEKGRVLIKKPGKMKWNYVSPEEKVFISDGAKIYSYIPADKQVIISTVPSEDSATTPALFLAGKGNITRDFTASLVPPPAGSSANTRALKLVPRKPQPDYDSLTLLVDVNTLALTGLVTEDPQGGLSTMLFTNLKENVALSDKDFAFVIPRGVDVVTDGAQR
jgi:outer membrane lipoprotein carrier protein